MKKLFQTALAVAAITIMSASCSQNVEPPVQSAQPSGPSSTQSAPELSTEEKVAQLFMVRCDSENMDSILDKQPGGIVMFAVDFDGLNADEVRDKINGFKSACDIEPIISVDEEGGTVVRVSSNPSLAEHKYESPQYYYKKGGMDEVNANTAEKSKLLSSLGITMNLAPVVDVSTNPDDFIYDRSLGENAQTTADFAAQTVKTMSENGILSCLKHFPGYGGNVDTHTGIAVDERPLESFRENDFLPFESGIQAGADAVLVSHNIMTAVDPSVPSSISAPVHDILREELGFDGLVITDDMSMAAMAEYEEPYKKAVLAGNDMMIVTDFETAYNEVLNAVNNGEISQDILDTAVERILDIKSQL